MATVEQLLAALEAEVGTTESPAGSNCQKYSHELGRPCEKWCDDFLDWIAKRIGLHLPIDSASTRVTAKAFQDAGRWGQNPKVGSWVFFDFPDTDHGIQHVEAVIDFDATHLTDIGGNTSFDKGGSQSNGGAVAKRRRERNGSIVGFGYPVYEEAPIPPVSLIEDEMIRIYNLTFDDGDIQYSRIGNTLRPLSAGEKAELLEMKPKDILEVTVYGPHAWKVITDSCVMK